MAWPFDARHKTYTALTHIQSATLNELQDRVKEIYGGGSEWFFINGFGEKAAASDEPRWLLDDGNPEYGWKALSAGGQLIIPLVFPTRTIITEVKVKVFIAAAVGLTARLYKVSHKRAAAATAPTRALVGGGYTSAGGAPADWRVGVVATGVTEVVDPITDYCHVEIANHDANDLVAGVFVDT